MSDAFIIDGVRTPIGSHGGSLSEVRPDDMAALVIRALMARHPGLDPASIDEVVMGCANQAGEDNRNVARMAALLAGLPDIKIISGRIERIRSIFSCGKRPSFDASTSITMAPAPRAARCALSPVMFWTTPVTIICNPPPALLVEM